MTVRDSEGLRAVIRACIRVVLVAAYATIILGGLFVTITPPTSYAWMDIAIQGLWVTGWVIGGIFALSGVAAVRHQWEMVGCWAIAAGTSVYVTLSWMNVWEKGTVHLPRAAILTAAVLLLITRALVLLDRNLQARDRIERHREATQ